MHDYIHATIASTFAWAGNIYDLLLLTYVYSYFEKVHSLLILDFSILYTLGHYEPNIRIYRYFRDL